MRLLLFQQSGKDYITLLTEEQDAVTPIGRVYKRDMTDEQFAEVRATIQKGIDSQSADLQSAAVYLRRFQDWRIGKDIRTLTEAGIAPKKLTKAINEILEFFNQSKPLINCEDCAHNAENEGRGTGCLVGKCEYSPITTGAKK